MEVNNSIPNNWNTWKRDKQVILRYYGWWQFIELLFYAGNFLFYPTSVFTGSVDTDVKSTCKEKYNFQFRKDRTYTLIYSNISHKHTSLISETADGAVVWKIPTEHFEPITRAKVIQLLEEFFGTKYQLEKDVGIFLCRVKTAAARLQKAGHKVDDLYIGSQMIRYIPQEFQSTVKQIYR
ncbi:hypothetical protein HNY73_006312 [Argiope bruennichi]|uniref:Uncharacterized protein n=1 Tax=Argiope bruennichi TaxID=94029 RepID=A0A8T0FRW1_ARGBR|nr:hypothetical protein HNY73_006312 [Argiope bruennichi]